MASGSRSNRREKYNNEEKELDRILKEADMYEEGLTFAEKKNLVSICNESREQQEVESSIRIALQDEPCQNLLNVTTQETVEQDNIGPAKKVPKIEQDEQIGDNKVVVEHRTSDVLSRTPSPDIFESSQNEEINAGITSSFSEESNCGYLDREKESKLETDEKTLRKQRTGESFITFSDSEEGHIETAEVDRQETTTKQDSQHILIENDESCQSFKSANDAMSSESPVFDSEPIKLQRPKYCVPPLNASRIQEYNSAMKTNILDCVVEEEPQSFYEIMLSKRNRGHYRRYPFFYDGSLNRKKQRFAIRSELTTNSIAMTEMLYKQKRCDSYDNKWAPPIRTCSEHTLNTMDKYLYTEPPECTYLPWGGKPYVLDWKTKKASPKSTKNHSPLDPYVTNFEEQEERPKKVLTNKPSSSGLSLTRAQRMLLAVTDSSLTEPRVVLQKIDTSESPAETEDMESKQQTMRGTTRKPHFFEIQKDDIDDDSEEDDTVWLEAKQQKGRGRGAARGNHCSRSIGLKQDQEAETKNVVAQSKRGGGKGRRGKGKRGRDTPKHVGMQPRLLRHNQDNNTENLLSHPSLNEEMAQCPICNQYFPYGEDIENHAATCIAFEESKEPISEKSCPRCNTVVPAAMLEKHNLRCKQKHRTASDPTQSYVSTSGQRNLLGVRNGLILAAPRSFSTGTMPLPGTSTAAPVAPVSDPVTQMNTYRSYVTMLADPGAKDEIKLKAAQELSENFELIIGSSQYPVFLEHAMKIFLKILSEGEPHFINEYNIQQVRKLILEMIHRLPTNDALRPHAKNLLSLMFKLLETENEENVLVGLRIIIELHKQYRPQFSPEIQHFLRFVKAIYRDLPNHLNKIFEPRAPIRVKDLTEIDINALLAETYTITAIQSEKKTADGTQITYNLIPRAVYSLKVLQELPIIVVLMYQLYKQNVHQDVEEFIPLIMSTIMLQPSPQHRANPAFNKEVFVDFMGAQIKTLSFLAYVIRIYQETVAQHSNTMVQGVIGLLTLCPPEVAHQRKELLVAARHILSTELRTKFVPVLEQLFDENILLGGGWTVHETLRSLAYSTLADLVHHVRHMLLLKHLASAVHLFSKNVHDESLPTSIQTMSCKLLLNLVDLIRQRSDAEPSQGPSQGRQLLMRMLEVFVLKFKIIVKLQLPVLMSKWKAQESPPKVVGATTVVAKEDTKPLLDAQNKEDKSKFGFPASQAANYSVADCRSLVKTLVCGAKTITWGYASCKTGADGPTKFQPKETLVFIKLVKWALQALDIYTLSPSAQPLGSAQQARGTPMQTVRTKEEKEVLEHFAGVFTMMDAQTFREVFSTSIDYMVNRIARNSALQIIGNTFLSNPSTSPIFATVLVEYLLERMEEMGHNVEKSNLYLRLFKLVFGCVSLFPQENEQMLRPHLHQIVNRAMELALSAREPYNYFLLLRALFRSIGGGSHDLLYQEFLPLLPNLLQGLNSLQSSLHKQHMKDLFVELCLTVPVRLSSLLPYLPMLMDPLVSALNGSHTLISQGLRTLELCVDNLQPDFLYEHIQPVRADLMQALWRTLRNPTDQVAHVAFRVLGKFGGGNRKMMIEPQRLEYNESETPGPAIITFFQDYKVSIAFPVEKVIDTAFVALKTNSTDAFYRRQSWEAIRCYLVASINRDVDDKQTLSKLLSHPSFTEGKINPPPTSTINKSADKQGRSTLQTALTGMFVAAAIRELRADVHTDLGAVVRHFTLVAVTQQAGPFPLGSVPRVGNKQLQGMDPFVLIDALTTIMGHEEKELVKPGILALILIIETATTVLGTKERACKLPMMQYLAECMCNLCYDRAWFAKVGGCLGIKTLLEHMSVKWVYEHLFLFLRALLFVMMDLTGEVSSGAVDIAKNLLEKMLSTCVSPPTTTSMEDASVKELLAAQQKSVNEVTHELVRQVTSPNTLVRQQAMHLLELLAGIQNKSITAVMEPFKEVLADIIPPRRHLLRHQPANAQIGLMDGNTFCTTLTPRLFTIDLSVLEHNTFLNDVTQMCEQDDSLLLKNPCYKSMTNLVPLRKSALKALAACHYIPSYRERIFNVLYKALEKPNTELQETAFECMKQFIAGFDIDIDMVHSVMRPLLLTLGDYRNLSLNGIKRLSYLTRLFPKSFNEKLCDQLLQHLRKLLEAAITNKVTNAATGIPQAGVETEQDKMAAIVGMFHQIPAASVRCLEVLCRLVLQTERSLIIEASSPFREPLMKFLLKYPAETISVFLQDNNIKEPQWTRYLEFLIEHKDGKPFRDVLQTSSVRLCTMAKGLSVSGAALTGTDRAEVVHQSIRLSFLLSRLDDQWLASQATLAATLQELWCSSEYQELHARVDSVTFPHWQQPRLITKVLLRYFCHHPNEVDLLFHLLRALCGRFIPDFQFLRDFLENTVAQTYSVEWKRAAFFRFVELFPQPDLSQELKARIVQYILIPCFSYSFENGQGESLIGSPAAPEQDNPDNVVSVFISRVIDPDNPFGNSDCVRILLLQFSCLLVEQASPHIHDVANKRQGNKLRRLMTFAWPCLLGKNCVDPATRYHGHLLLSHIIAKFAIHKRIVLQVFHSLLKAHALDARVVVRQALEILTPAMPVRMEDGNTMLTHWTKKIIVEEGHSMPQLFHILLLVVRHYQVYYPVRHHLVQYIITSIQRLGFSPASTIDYRKLAVELAEVVIKWELQRIRDETADENNTSNAVTGQKRLAADESMEPRKRHTSGSLPAIAKLPEGSNKPIEKNHAEAVLNLLLRLACQVNDAPGQAGSAAAATANTGQASQGELLSRRCVALFKTALKPDMWPHCDLKLAWFDKLLVAANATPQPNFANICTALELLTYLLSDVLTRDQHILNTFKPLQRGLAACMTCTNFKVIRLVHALLSRLMTIFPTEPLSSNVASQYEELNGLYATVSRIIHEGLETFDKNPTAPTSSLFGTLMLLKAACVNNTCYIDRLISLFMRVLQRITREHLTPGTSGGAASAAAAAAASGAVGSGESSPVASELLIVSLDLVKSRVGVMGVDMRKSFIGTILVGLIEKTPDVKVMRAITKMMEDWMKSKNPLLVNQMPSLREKSILLVKLMQYVEKRFPDDAELNAHFLEIVNFIYRDESLKTTELATKLEPAFMSGLRCSQPLIRAKFFEVFDDSIRRKLFDRLLYIVSSQNWESMGAHYWIKQCIELLLVTAVNTTHIQAASTTLVLPGVCSVLHTAEPADRANFVVYTGMTEEPMDSESNQGEEDLDLEMTTEAGEPRVARESRQITDRRVQLQLLVARQYKFLQSASEVRTYQFLQASAQLCHMDSTLAERTWLELMPRLWHILSERHQAGLIGEMVPFLCSGAHVVQKDCQPSALNTFVEALSYCDPPIPIKPCLMKYLGKSHNLWHRMALSLERLAFDPASNKLAEEKPGDCYEFEPIVASPQQETLDSLSDMYWLLCEEDLWAGLWQRHAHFPETNTAIAWEQQGFFEQAQAAYEMAMNRMRTEYATSTLQNQPSLEGELVLWEKHWIRCAKELNQWEQLLEYGNSKSASNPQLVLESAWRVPDWDMMKEALQLVELGCPKEMQWKLHLYRGFLAVCKTEEQHLGLVERHVEAASALCMREWRRLPRVVSHIHLPLLQAAQQIMELQEAAQIHQGLLHGRATSLHDMKAIVKTWRNRLPVMADELSHWSDVFTWRQHHYQFISNHYDQQGDAATANHSMLGVHASAQAIIHFGKVARKHGLINVCLDSLSRIYTIPSVPIVDCFQKIRQQVKCYVQLASRAGPVAGRQELQEGLEVIESTNLKYFTKDMTAEFHALKGMLLAKIGRSEEANKAFSAAVQLHDTLVKAWALWGDYLEAIFTQQPFSQPSGEPIAERNMQLGVAAITCFMHACRHQNESKSRKYLAKVLWLFSYDDSRGVLAEAIDKYSVGVPWLQWLPWIPQLLTCLVHHEGKMVLNLLSGVGRMFPQAVYFPIRTLYLTLKIEQRERYKSAELQAAASGLQHTEGLPNGSGAGDQTSASTANGARSQPGASATTHPIRATPPMWRCSRIMHMQREIHPTVLSSLEGIVDQMVWFRESWYEEVVRQLRQGLAKCYTLAFESRGDVDGATITPHTLNFVRKLSSTFGIGIENMSNTATGGGGGGTFSSAGSESLVKRAQQTVQDPVFHRMKGQFKSDFDISAPEAMKLHNLISKLKKWIKILESKSKILPKTFLVEEKCRFLSNFSLQTAEVELPGELLLPKHSHYYVRISRFMPRVEVVNKHNTAARRMYIRGHNGKTYPYLVVNDSGLGEARREERVLQLLRLLNHFLGKQKETSRRFLHLTVPRVVAVSPQMRLVEDNPASVSLMSVFKQRLARRGLDPEGPVARYYERLKGVQAQGQQAGHAALMALLQEVQATMVPPELMREWALHTFPSATDYWTFRKMFTLQLALAGLVEYVLHLTRLNPDMMYIHQDSGLLNVAYFKFDVDDATGNLDANRPVPFRLTPALAEFVTAMGIHGPLTASMVAAARCLAQPSFKVHTILRAILRDEMIAWHKKKYEDQQTPEGSQTTSTLEGENLINMVTRAVSAISQRLNSLAMIETGSPVSTADASPGRSTDSTSEQLLNEKVSTLVAAASNPSNLCRMDPAWHPWL